MREAKRQRIICVVGGGAIVAPEDSAIYVQARETGKLIAEAGCILLCGGRGGVMEAAARGAREAGGLTIGILPNRRANAGANEPNEFIDVAVFTGLGDGRNYVNACAADAVIALAGGAGTLSEIALAFKVGTPVVYLDAWQFLAAEKQFAAPVVETAEAAVVRALELIAREAFHIAKSAE
jgi:uncharacterized protein (TIGR00725 family)